MTLNLIGINAIRFSYSNFGSEITIGQIVTGYNDSANSLDDFVPEVGVCDCLAKKEKRLEDGT